MKLDIIIKMHNSNYSHTSTFISIKENVVINYSPR